MIDTQLLTAIRKVIRLNELGTDSPYRLCFARLGNSGGSFGLYQGDAHIDQPRVPDMLRRILNLHGTDQATANRILAAVSQACPVDPLSADDKAVVDAALDTPGGRALVDQLDGEIERTLVERVQTCIDAAAGARLAVALDALLYIACWINMSGKPNQLNRWIAGTTVYNLPPPQPPRLEGSHICDYLRRTAFFAKHPRNFDHLRDCVSGALA